jgi:coenzyme Q-binding protein COQ10
MMQVAAMEVGMHHGAGSGRDGVSGAWGAEFDGYTPEQLFALAADIESYPRFVPWCVATRIAERHADHWRCDNVFGKGPIRLRFHTRASFDPPHSILITGEDGPFHRFELRWRFVPISGGCRLEVGFTMQFRSELMALLARVSMAEVERRVVAAFRRQVGSLYGPAA